jgi:hypothetical protein
MALNIMQKRSRLNQSFEDRSKTQEKTLIARGVEAEKRDAVVFFMIQKELGNYNEKCQQ